MLLYIALTSYIICVLKTTDNTRLKTFSFDTGSQTRFSVTLNQYFIHYINMKTMKH